MSIAWPAANAYADAMRLVVNNCVVPGRSGTVSIVCDDGTISEVAPAGAVASIRGDVVIDAEGRFVSPPFVDAHFHLDSVLTRVPNRSGTLREGIDNWAHYKRSKLTVEDVYQRANRYCEHAFARGIQAIRSHVDVCDQRLLGVEALLQIRADWKDRIDIQLVAFPQDGFFDGPETRSLLIRALDMGVDVVGGIPHNERTGALGHRSIVELMEIADERDLLVDMHCDESDDPGSRHVEILTDETYKRNMGERVTASHITSTAMMDRYYLNRKLIPLMARTGIHVIANPLINVHLGGHFHHPAPRAMAPIKELLAAGITVACGQDCNEDPWYPLGDADMFEVAKMGAHVGHMMGLAQLDEMYRTITYYPARIMRLDGYGLDPGARASFVIFDAPTLLDAMRTSAERLVIVRDGTVAIDRRLNSTTDG